MSVNKTKKSAIAKKILAHFIFSGRYSSCLGYSEVITIKSVLDCNLSFSNLLSTQECGTAEIVIPPNSSLINQSARDVRLRKTYGIAMVALHRGGNTVRWRV
jgi:di/tricarboxylate transporter